MQVEVDVTKFQLSHILISTTPDANIIASKMGGGFGLINTGEDCLHLSVHVPVQDEEEGALAVMVSKIHVIMHEPWQK